MLFQIFLNGAYLYTYSTASRSYLIFNLKIMLSGSEPNGTVQTYINEINLSTDVIVWIKYKLVHKSAIWIAFAYPAIVWFVRFHPICPKRDPAIPRCDWIKNDIVAIPLRIVGVSRFDTTDNDDDTMSCYGSQPWLRNNHRWLIWGEKIFDQSTCHFRSAYFRQFVIFWPISFFTSG